ncbi:MAG: hypothetical protein JWN38_908 [Candidatus Saccharibacteria bacterium]|nr:hypothetical protein [Candidatus Saccharibacteria bacterium]
MTTTKPQTQQHNTNTCATCRWYQFAMYAVQMAFLIELIIAMHEFRGILFANALGWYALFTGIFFWLRRRHLKKVVRDAPPAPTPDPPSEPPTTEEPS